MEHMLRNTDVEQFVFHLIPFLDQEMGLYLDYYLLMQNLFY